MIIISISLFHNIIVLDVDILGFHPFFCRDIELKAPFAMEEGKRELHYTYLDTIGRPVVVVQKSNLVEQHIQDFEVYSINLLTPRK